MKQSCGSSFCVCVCVCVWVRAERPKKGTVWAPLDSRLYLSDRIKRWLFDLFFFCVPLSLGALLLPFPLLGCCALLHYRPGTFLFMCGIFWDFVAVNTITQWKPVEENVTKILHSGSYWLLTQQPRWASVALFPHVYVWVCELWWSNLFKCTIYPKRSSSFASSTEKKLDPARYTYAQFHLFRAFVHN